MKLTIRGCWECPCRREQFDSGNLVTGYECGHPDEIEEREIEADHGGPMSVAHAPPPPTWCPLRREPLTLEVEDDAG